MVILVAVVAGWEIVAKLGASGVPAGIGGWPSLLQVWTELLGNWSEIAHHAIATARRASLGFVLSATVSAGFAFSFLRVPASERVFRPVLVAAFSAPLIVLVPILSSTLSPEQSAVICAGLGSFYPLLVETLLGLRRVDTELLDVAKAAGGKSWRVLIHVRLRAALPSILAGAAVAAPGALLGAMLAELGSPHNGLGKYLVGLLQSGRTAATVALILVATALSGGAYVALSHSSRRLSRGPQTPKLRTGDEVDQLAYAGETPRIKVIYALASSAVVLLGWQLLAGAAGVPEIVKPPAAIVDYLFLSEDASGRWASLASASEESVLTWAVGVAAGVSCAFVLALTKLALPTLSKTLTTVAVVTQTVPLVAFVALLALLFGRGFMVTLVVAISASFFPSYVCIVDGLSRAPEGTLDVVRVSGGDRWQILRFVRLPAAVPYLFSALRLAAPRVLLGVLLGEYLVTYRGLGLLLFRSRGYFDFGMVWSIVLLVVLGSLALDSIAARFERRWIT